MKGVSRIAVKYAPILGSFLMFAAVYGGVKPACWGWLYQPKMPKYLQ